MDRFTLTLLFLIYGMFSSPTPDFIGWPEIACAITLIFLSRHFIVAFYIGSRSAGDRPALYFTAYAFFAGLVMTAVNPAPETHGWHIEISKDAIATLFLALPLFIRPSDKDRSNFAQLFLKGMLFVGTAFSLRFLSGLWSGENEATSAMMSAIFHQNHNLNADQLYLANSPLVIFTCLYSLYAIFHHLRLHKPLILPLLLYSALFLISALSVSLMLQRLTLALLAVSFIILMIWLAAKRPLRAGLIAALTVSFVYLNAPLIQDIIHPFIEKTWRSGSNMRLAEWQAVLSTLSANPLYFLFGLGFGGGFEAPTVGGMNVGYTHSLLSALLLKFGILGLVLFLAFIFHIAKTQKSDDTNWPFIIALWTVFLIGCFFYANYKSFGFGCIIWMLANIGQMTHKQEDEYKKPIK